MAQHKYAQTGLVGRTSVSRADVIAMAEACANSQEADFFRGLGPLAITDRAKDGLQISVMGGLGNKYKQLVFIVKVTEEGDGRIVRTKILSYRTSQTTVMYFIPAGPKLMVGYKSYELFLTRLARTLTEADPSAGLQISSVADTLAAPAAGTAVGGESR